MKVIDKKPDEGASSELDMHPQDAAHAVARDPDRYEVIAATAAENRAELRSRMSTEQRVAAIESLLDEFVTEEDLTRMRDARAERAAAAEQEAAAAKPKPAEPDPKATA